MSYHGLVDRNSSQDVVARHKMSYYGLVVRHSKQHVGARHKMIIIMVWCLGTAINM